MSKDDSNAKNVFGSQPSADPRIKTTTNKIMTNGFRIGQTTNKRSGLSPIEDRSSRQTSFVMRLDAASESGNIIDEFEQISVHGPGIPPPSISSHKLENTVLVDESVQIRRAPLRDNVRGGTIYNGSK